MRSFENLTSTTTLFAVTLLLLSGCASSPKTISNADPTTDFSQYATFGFYEQLATDKEQYESIVSSFLKVAVSQQLSQRGLVYAENPDLIVNFYIHTKEKVRSRNVPAAGGYYGYRDPFGYDPWFDYPAYETRIDQYTEGTLNIDAVDAKAQKLVWEGMVSGRITDNDIRNMEKTIDEAVAAIMANFPIQ